jgi:hypothetical protein
MRLLLKFFLNSSTTSYLRDLESEFGESTNAIRIELNRFEEAGFLESNLVSNRKYYKANTRHPLFPDINNILHKYIGFDRIVEEVAFKLGNLASVFVCGTFAKGIDSDLIELIFIGQDLDEKYLSSLVSKASGIIRRNISYVTFSEADFEAYKKNELNGTPLLLLWQA